MSFLSYMADRQGKLDPDEHGDSERQLQLLNMLNKVFDEKVDAASYDYLREANCSVASFLICNASLRLTGKSWAQCRGSLDARASNVVLNKAVPHAAIDVVRLAKARYASKQATRKHERPCKPWPLVNKTSRLSASTDVKLAPTPSHPEIVAAAEQMPLKCERLDGLFHAEMEKWFALSGALKPRSHPKPVCAVDLTSLEPRHWRLIDKLLPDCQGSKLVAGCARLGSLWGLG